MAVPVHVAAAAPVLGTQSFVRTLSECWKRPSLTGLEVLWRWVYGIPALWVLLGQGRTVIGAATDGSFDPARLGLDKALLNDPVGALTADPLGVVGRFGGAVSAVAPGVGHVAVWLAPVLLVLWVLVSSLGRTAVLRRADRTLHARVLTVMALQTIRMAALACGFLLWFRLLIWSARVAVERPIQNGAEPNLVLYCALVIVLTLVLFVLWSVVSWYFSIAPLLAMREDLGVLASLGASGRIGSLKGKLVEVNLVMGIVKIALLVLAMVFSATPLPFESVTTPEFLAWWWAGVTLVYLLGSDFFHVARLVAYLRLWRQTAVPN